MRTDDRVGRIRNKCRELVQLTEFSCNYYLGKDRIDSLIAQIDNTREQTNEEGALREDALIADILLQLRLYCEFRKGEQ